MRRIESFLILLYGISSFAIIFVLAPLISIYLLNDPSVFYKVFAEDPLLYKEAYDALILTFETSILATTMLLIMSIPIAYLLARIEFKGKEFIEAIIDIPLLTPHVVAGIMLLSAFGRHGIIGLGIEDTILGIIFVMMFVSLPIMVDTLKAGFRMIDRNLEYIARSLGASLYRSFKDITIPLSKHTMIAGYILAWARGVSEVGALLIVAYFPKTINILIYEWYSIYGLKYAIALSIVLLTLFLLVFILIRLVTRK